MTREPLSNVLKQTKLVYLKLGNAKFSCKTYSVFYNNRLNKWTCTCNGFVKSGGKNTCKHILASALILSIIKPKNHFCPFCGHLLKQLDSKNWYCECMPENMTIILKNK